MSKLPLIGVAGRELSPGVAKGGGSPGATPETVRGGPRTASPTSRASGRAALPDGVGAVGGPVRWLSGAEGRAATLTAHR